MSERIQPGPQDVPDDLEMRAASPPPRDTAMGVEGTAPARPGPAPNSLVVIGDSVSHGVLSGAVWRTQLAWPALLADVLGIDDFRIPRYGGPGPGLPVNIETLVRMVGERFGSSLSWFEVVRAGLTVRRAMDEVEDYWERGPGSAVPFTDGPILHNLSVLGFDLADALTLDRERITEQLEEPTDQLIGQVPEQSALRAGLVVFGSAATGGDALTQLGAAQALGARGDGPGIDTLVVMLGANNALRTVTELRVTWSPEDFDPDTESDFTVSRPSHFAQGWQHIVAQLEQVQARTVVLTTVPHVTIAPIARGVGDKMRPGSRFFPYYTRPWITDEQFDPARDSFITGDQARAVDSAIDQFNDVIADSVAAARADGRNWLLFDLSSLLDRLAFRRYFEDPSARPDWFEPYELPPELAGLDPPPDTRFYGADETGRVQGGIFSLDGIHPTTIAQGLIAHELLAMLADAGVAPVDAAVDFTDLITRDTLITSPPVAFDAALSLFGWLDQTVDLIGRFAGFD